MDFGLDEQQVMLQTSARDFLEKECPKTLVRQMMEDETGYELALWKKMAELGWMSLTIPEEYGGIGMSFLDLAVLLEEMGRALLPGPFVSTVVLAATAILEAGNEAQKKEYLPSIAAGETIMTLAWLEPGVNLQPSGIKLNASPEGEGFVLNGTKLFVPDAHVAKHIICVARTEDTSDPSEGITLFVVDSSSSGISIQPLQTITGKKQCEVTFNDVIVSANSILGELNEGWGVVKRILEAATVAECALASGGARWVLENSVNYAKERTQFGVPIGSFQAIQHKCANMSIIVEGATALTYYAAWTVADDNPERSLAVAMAKAWCSDNYKLVAGEGIQIHGGIGFTWDHDMHLYFKQAKTSEISHGDGNHQRRLLADLMGI